MEVFSTTFCAEKCLKPFILNPTSGIKYPSGKTRTGFVGRKLNFKFLRSNREKVGNFSSFTVNNTKDSKQQESQVEDWELEFLGKRGSIDSNPPQNSKQEKSRLLKETDSMDWCIRARKVALKSIEVRGMRQSMESLVGGKNQKKKKKSKKNVGNKSDKKLRVDDDDDDGFEFASDLDDEIESNGVEIVDNRDQLKNAVSMLGNGMFEERKKETMETFIQRLSQFSGPSDRKKEVNLNRTIVDAQTAEEVLEVVSDMITAVGKGLSPSPLSPLNLATALHRIAKNMEKVSMMESRRLAFARQREMSMLVGIAMTALPECSAQGISNIAWALSKIGGELLYMTEMDRVAEVAISKVGAFNSQNVANVAGGFASMRHSAPELFLELSKRASDIIETFHAQELAQLLWAFAFLNEPADALLEALDNIYKEPYQFQCSPSESSAFNESLDLATKGSNPPVLPPVLRFNRDQLGNIAWSYAVLGQMDRNFFSIVWKSLQNFEEERITDFYREDVMFASQVYLANQCLKVEYTHLNLSLKSDVEEKIARAGRTRRFNQKVTSSFQKEVARLLYSTGLEWVREYALDAYTLDAALVDKKVAMEIDGPTHFSRNSWVPLGHTMLKRRYISASGWNLVSVSLQQWEELEGSVEQQEYLRQLLKDYIGGDSTKYQAPAI